MGLNNRTLKVDWHTPQQDRGARSPTPRPLRGGQRGSPTGKGLASKEPAGQALRSRGRARTAGPTAPGWIRNIISEGAEKADSLRGEHGGAGAGPQHWRSGIYTAGQPGHPGLKQSQTPHAHSCGFRELKRPQRRPPPPGA